MGGGHERAHARRSWFQTALNRHTEPPTIRAAHGPLLGAFEGQGVLLGVGGHTCEEMYMEMCEKTHRRTQKRDT